MTDTDNEHQPSEPTPNKERIQEWVDELRSGRHKQVRNHLRIYEDGMTVPDASRITHRCCLDVANFVAFRNGVEDDSLTKESDGYVLATGDLTRNAEKWFGFNSADPVLNYDGRTGRETYAATALNDDLHLDFNSIADAITETYLND